MAILKQYTIGKTRITIMDDYLPKNEQEKKLVEDEIRRVVTSILENNLRRKEVCENA